MTTSDTLRVIWHCELVISIIAFIFAGLSIYIICRKKVLHRNLRILLVNLPITQALTLITRLVLLFNDLNIVNAENAAYFCDYGLFFKSLSLIALSVERAVASLISERYENCGFPFPTFGVALVAIQWFCGAILAVLEYLDIIYYSNVLLILLCSYVAAFIIFASSSWATKKYNWFKLKELQQSRVFSLSHRYQISENLKCAHDLNLVIFIITVTELAGTLPLIVCIKIPCAPRALHFATSVCYSSSAVQTILMTIALSGGFTRLKARIQKRRLRNAIMPSSDNPHITTDMAPKEMQAVHFNQLCKAWA